MTKPGKRGRKPDLNPKQRRFVDEFLIDCNKKRAAIRAGYSKKNAESIGSRLSRNIKVAAEIERRLIESAMTAGEVLHEAKCIAQSDILDIFGEDGRPLHPKDMPAHIRKANSH